MTDPSAALLNLLQKPDKGSQNPLLSLLQNPNQPTQNASTEHGSTNALSPQSEQLGGSPSSYGMSPSGNQHRSSYSSMPNQSQSMGPMAASSLLQSLNAPTTLQDAKDLADTDTNIPQPQQAFTDGNEGRKPNRSAASAQSLLDSILGINKPQVEAQSNNEGSGITQNVAQGDLIPERSPQGDQTTLSESASATAASGSTAASPASSKPIFNYVNPFHLLSQSPRPAADRQSSGRASTRSQLTNTSSVADLAVQSNHPSQMSDKENNNVPHTHTQAGKSSSISSYRFPLRRKINLKIKEHGLNFANHDTEFTPIALLPSKLAYRKGALITVSEELICYVTKETKVRLIYQPRGTRALLKIFSHPIIDLAIGTPKFGASKSTSLLATVDDSGSVTVTNVNVAGDGAISCDTLISFGSSASDSAATVRWYPNVERTLLISTKYNIYLVQLDKLSGKDPVDLTATDSVDGIAKISPGQEIKSCTFSPDGSVIAIAFGTSISLWSLESLTEVHSIRSSPGDGNASEYSSIAFVPLPNGPARYILAGKQCNLVLQLWDLEGSRVEPVQELEFKCQSVDTSASFNAILFEPKVPSLLVANSSREAVFVITLQAGAGADVGEPNRSSSHESDADLCKRVASHNNMPDTTDNLSIAFQHISEILVKDPTISLAWTPTISKTDKFDFYALQETVVRLYHLPYNVIQPKDWQMAPVIEVEDASANVATVSLAQKSDSVHEETGPESTEHLIEAGTTSDVIASVERLKERRLSEHSATLKDGQTRADDDPLKEKLALNKNKTLKQVLGIRTPTPIVSPLVGPETDAQQASVPDISSGNEEEELMESAPVRSVDVSSSSSVADESLLATSKPVNGSKEVKQGRHRGNNENGAILEARVKSPTVNSPVLPQEGESLAENSHSQVEGAVLAKNLRKLEREILAGVDKIVQREMQQHRKQLAHERQANQNAENQRQQTLLRYVCSTLNNNTQKVLEQIIKQEIQNSVLPAISELANIQVEKAFGNQSTEKIAKTVALHVQKSLPTLKGDSKLSREAMDSITDSIQLAVFPAVDNAFRKMSADLEKRLLAKLEPLQQQQAQMTNLLQIMAQMQGSIEDMKRQLQEMQRNSGLVTSQPQPLHPRTPFNPNLTFAEPMMPPHLVAVNQEVDQAAMAGDWEEAFLKALQTADQAVIIRLCSKCDPGVVFGGNCQLSQPVLLSLLHHLSLDLGQQTDLRLTWMIDVLQALNPQDLEIAQPYAIVLPSVLQRVDEVQQQLSTQPGQEMTRQKMMYLAAIVRQRLAPCNVMLACVKLDAKKRKIVILGDGACGKTSLLKVFTQGYFPQVYEPTVFKNYTQAIEVRGTTVELSLWDTAGQEEFDRLRSLAYADSHVAMLCFAVDNRNSLENIEVALKCDLRHDPIVKDRLARFGTSPVTYEEGLELAKQLRAARYLECSAKFNRGVQECFQQVAQVALNAKLIRSHENIGSGLCSLL